MRRWLSTFGICAAVPALLLSGGCGLFADEPEDLDFGEHAGRLTEMYNETARLSMELDDAEARIAKNCLEDKGFTVHDDIAFYRGDFPARETFLERYPIEPFLPTVEEASERGFWSWTNSDLVQVPEYAELYASYEAMQEAEGLGPPFGDEEEPPEFYHLSPEEQYEWYAAYHGEERAREYNGYLIGIEREVDEDGEEIFLNPKPGGCELEMLTALYGEPEPVEIEEEPFDDWSGRPSSRSGTGRT